MNIKEECIEFDFPQNAKWAEYSNSPERNIIFFPRRIQTDFYVLCQPENIQLSEWHAQLGCDTSVCEFCCLLSFGVNPAAANPKTPDN